MNYGNGPTTFYPFILYVLVGVRCPVSVTLNHSRLKDFPGDWKGGQGETGMPGTIIFRGRDPSRWTRRSNGREKRRPEGTKESNRGGAEQMRGVREERQWTTGAQRSKYCHGASTATEQNKFSSSGCVISGGAKQPTFQHHCPASSQSKFKLVNQSSLS